MTDYPNPALPALEAKLARGMPLDGPALVKSPLRGDLSNSGLKDQAAVKEAAVLILLIFKDGILSILFTQRPETMKEHPGQISFPGGRAAPGDQTPDRTALREANEEIGLSFASVNIIGRLPAYHTITRYKVTPVIGVIRNEFSPVIDPREVVKVFHAPVSFFLDKTNAQTQNRMSDGKERTFYAFQYRDHFIWGATAAMLINLREALLAYAMGSE
ncbi:MAG: CoA pyrophosphatase [Sphingomonadales bacterium]